MKKQHTLIKIAQ